MMITTLTGVSTAVISLIVFSILLAFAIYDIKCMRVPNKGLACFIIFIIAALLFQYFSRPQGSALWYILDCLAGLVVGGSIPLAVAVITNGGIGGGDIKLAAVVGLFYGPYGMLTIFFIGTLALLPIACIKKLKDATKELHIAFVPFMALGSLLPTLLNLKGVFF